MTSVLFAMGFLVVIAFATYLKLPLTSVYLVCLAALAFSSRATPEPLNSILDLFKIPAQVVQAYGTQLGFQPQGSVALCLGATFVFDMVLTSALGWRRR